MSVVAAVMNRRLDLQFAVMKRGLDLHFGGWPDLQSERSPNAPAKLPEARLKRWPLLGECTALDGLEDWESTEEGWRAKDMVRTARMGDPGASWGP